MFLIASSVPLCESPFLCPVRLRCSLSLFLFDALNRLGFSGAKQYLVICTVLLQLQHCMIERFHPFFVFGMLLIADDDAAKLFDYTLRITLDKKDFLENL